MLRELDQRTRDGVIVTLEWDSELDRVQLRCESEHTPSRPLFCYPVEPGDARLAFLYPFALRPRGDIASANDRLRAESDARSRPGLRRWFHARIEPKAASVTDASDSTGPRSDTDRSWRDATWPWWLL